MLSNWIKPFNKEDITFSTESDQKLSSQIINYTDSTVLNHGDLCLLGIGKQANGVRKFLYQYSTFSKNFRLVDLGNVRNTQTAAIIPILKELRESGLTVLVIDSEGIGPKLLFDHFNAANEIFNPVIVDEYLRKDSSSFDISCLNNELYSCLGIDYIGSQMHLDRGNIGDGNYKIRHLRLGKLRRHKASIEPHIRNSNFCYFNLNAIRKADAPGKTGTNPSGLWSEEASQIARYAGLSEKLSHFMIGGFWHIESQTAELISQMLWYFMEGFSKRTKDDIGMNSEIQQYIVHLKDPSMNLMFLKSEKTGRWWFKLKTEVNNQSIYKHIPCTYQDYQAACNDEVSEWVLDAIENH